MGKAGIKLIKHHDHADNHIISQTLEEFENLRDSRSQIKTSASRPFNQTNPSSLLVKVSNPDKADSTWIILTNRDEVLQAKLVELTVRDFQSTLTVRLIID